jgi:hypothetical protein
MRRRHANVWRKQRHANAFHFASLAEMAEVEGCNSEQRQKQRRVVVAVDESEESMHALSWALQYLLLHDSKEDHVILLHAQSPLGFMPQSMAQVV